ncbi:MAG: FtsX-like permease family protein [Lachnospiraceae bacterium]|nr:FtsX-like permease family protein [Lachnospiraceae bacterium]
MEYKTLLKENLKQHKGSSVGIFILTLLVTAVLGIVLNLWSNSQVYIEREIRRDGFGDITAWVSNVPDTGSLTDSIKELTEVDRIETQSLIFSNYVANNKESDSEGQLITFVPGESRYKFFTNDLSAYSQDITQIEPGEIYVSPSMVSMFNVQVGDKITFPIARAGKDVVFTVKGFYEDPFMGSSMIGMKGFLICEEDRTDILDMLQNAGIDALARDGVMLHIFASDNCQMTFSELNGIINQNTSLPEYTEFVHSRDAITGFMLILQNAFSGLFLAFVIVLLFVVMVVISHSISSTIEADTVNMGILKTIGFTSAKLQKIQLFQYLLSIIIGMLSGFLLAVPLSRGISSATITSIGVKIPTKSPLLMCVISFAGILFLLAVFIIIRTGKIRKLTPIKAISGENDIVTLNSTKMLSAFGTALNIRLSLRQLATGKRRYIGAMIVAILLVFFASLVGRMDSWLGSDGKGMMDAFNPADHDIGVQVFGNLTAEEAEKKVLSYTDITDSYMLAMPGVVVNGIDYTANVISEPERFHILEGRTCEGDNEVVLTEFVAANFGISIGDVVTVRGDKGSDEYIVSGIYSCANDMGDNVGMSCEGYLKIGSDNPHIWCYHYFLSDSSVKSVITEALETAYGGDVHVHENTWPGLFGIISAMRALLVFMYIMVFLFILIVTIMTGSKILSAEQKDLGIYKAIGFQTNSLRMTFALRFGIVAVIGSIIGIILAAIFTDPLVSTVMKLAGISNFSSNPSIGGMLFPAVTVIILFTCVAYFAAGKIKKVDLTILIAD